MHLKQKKEKKASPGTNQHAIKGGGVIMTPPKTTADIAAEAGISERTG
jgi:hypothetical protein